MITHGCCTWGLRQHRIMGGGENGGLISERSETVNMKRRNQEITKTTNINTRATSTKHQHNTATRNSCISRTRPDRAEASLPLRLVRRHHDGGGGPVDSSASLVRGRLRQTQATLGRPEQSVALVVSSHKSVTAPARHRQQEKTNGTAGVGQPRMASSAAPIGVEDRVGSAGAAMSSRPSLAGS